MGKIILDNLILNNNSYGIKTNKYNVRQNEFNNITALKRWENENPEWMDIIQTAIKKGKSGKNAV